MNDDIIRMARERDLIEMGHDCLEGVPLANLPELIELVRADTRNATLDEIAKKIEAMPFGDTAASFAVWIREQKT